MTEHGLHKRPVDDHGGSPGREVSGFEPAPRQQRQVVDVEEGVVHRKGSDQAIAREDRGVRHRDILDLDEHPPCLVGHRRRHGHSQDQRLRFELSDQLGLDRPEAGGVLGLRSMV